MLHLIYAAAILCLAALPALMVFRNMPLFCLRQQREPAGEPRVSILIPARDEAAGIATAVEAALASRGAEVEVIVMDDHSTDGTAAIVGEMAQRDARVRLENSKPLPAGWNGKQHACWQLSQHARYELLLFVDADVRLEPQAAEVLASELNARGVDLLSGFPRQVTESWSERLLVPMMYFVLLGYLPLDRMRASRRPEFGAGCGQLFLARQAAYATAEGHASIKESRHDGLKLPRSFRAAGFATDLLDASDLAHVRMYDGWQSVWLGLQKNATEGIANARLIVPFSILLLGAALLPGLSLAHALYWGWSWVVVGLLGLATLLTFLPRALIAWHVSQSWLGVWLHPLAVTLFVAAQWIAFGRSMLGLPPVRWRGRQ